MNWYRALHTLGMHLTFSAQKRANYIKKHHLFRHMGDGCMVMFRKLPLYPELISVGNNVWIASNVLLVTHDTIHRVLNRAVQGEHFQENLGCIEIQDHVFIGSGSIILPNVSIGTKTVIAAGSLVNKSLPGNGVYGGVPARYLGSFDAFVEKRKNQERITIEKNKKRRLSDQTVEAVWERFHSIQTGGMQNES